LKSKNVLLVLMLIALLPQTALSETKKTFVMETFQNTCIIIMAGNVPTPGCNEENYPLIDENDSNIRHKVLPDGSKTSWGVFEVNSDGTLERVQHFFLSTQTASSENSFADLINGKIYLHTNQGYTIYDPSDNSIEVNSKEGYVSSSSGVIFKDINLNDVITKKSDGSIHIGENSLVTVEENGVQQLYATDANDDMIDINIKKGTDLLIDGVSVADSLNTNATNIATNTTDIATNTTSIATNTTDIATNTTSIATNTTDIATNTAEIATYKDSIASNTTAVAALGSDLSTFKASTNSQMNYMKSDYSSGIASAVAMSQFNLAQDGFSIGVGRGSYNDENETAFGLGYGGEFKNGTLFKLQASKSGDASGVGLTISF